LKGTLVPLKEKDDKALIKEILEACAQERDEVFDEEADERRWLNQERERMKLLMKKFFTPG
jgi:hypothetical protein